MWLGGSMRRASGTAAHGRIPAAHLGARWAVVGVGALVLAACSGADSQDEPSEPDASQPAPATATPGDDSAATQVPDGVSTTLPAPEGQSAAAADGDDSAADPAQATEEATLADVEIELPGSWQVQDLGEADLEQADLTQFEGDDDAQTSVEELITDGLPPQLWCLVPPEGAPPVDGCAGVLVAVGGDWLPGAGGAPYRPEQVNGWRSGPDQVPCPVEDDGLADEPDSDGQDTDQAEDDAAQGEDAADSEESAATSNVIVTEQEGEPVSSVTAQVGNYTAIYETWRATCSQTGETITPQVWYFPDLNVAVKDVLGHPDTFAIVNNLEG